MSQALFERVASDHHEARSAGTEPAERIHSSVAIVMNQEGIDLSQRVPRLLTHDIAQWADVVITMGCGDACPVIPGKRYIDWDLRDPKDLPLDEVRAIRDDIEHRVTDLVKDLDRGGDSQLNSSPTSVTAAQGPRPPKRFS
jgi:arsenate reductase